MKRVCAVLVTYNRLKYLKKLLNALENLTYPLEGILIYNNKSTDGTSAFLAQRGFKDISKDSTSNGKYVFNSDQNLGGAGGFANAIKIAKSMDYDYLWIMDDDVLPEKDCLALLLKTMEEKKVQVALPSRNDAYYQDRVCENFDFSSTRKYCPYSRKKIIQYPLTQDTYFVADMPFEGPLIDIELVRKVGIPNAGFFLEYDDSDYAQRLQKYSQIVYVTKAILHRQLAKKQSKKSAKKDLYTWRTYYTLRNDIIFERKYGKNWRVKEISPRLLLLHKTVKSILDGYAKHNLPLLFKAYSDGMHGRMGKLIKPNY
ncbi:glycosyltransferase family 2 protein [Lactobacillus sp. Marseille-P7033]|nr:glycosyltransferase family 2 protein [Lactobacillus sp. Marseille-P7033]NGC77340.1 glycosyltransferase [Limosilactobacillus reuteri]